jgi:hypothetical protein
MSADSNPWLLPSTPRPLHHWQGESRSWYCFSIYPAAEIPDFDGVVYLMTRVRQDGLYDPLYCGQSSRGGERLSRHEKLEPARRRGLTHIHVHFLDDSSERFRVETDVRRMHRPPLNEQSVPTYSALSGLPGVPSPPTSALGNAFLSRVLAEPTHATSVGDLRGLGALADYLAPSRFLEPSNGLAAALNAFTPPKTGR